MNNPEDNKKEVAKRMLTEVMENIDFSKVTAIHLALKLSGQNSNDHSKEAEDNKEPNNIIKKVCSECGPDKECKCDSNKEANDSY
tara:strand:- start:211 stop:465 length:255 start_codon:yes stop_codon:yes gene_type:complete